MKIFILKVAQVQPFSQEYYKVIEKCRKINFILNEMKREDFISTKPPEDAVFGKLKNANGVN